MNEKSPQLIAYLKRQRQLGLSSILISFFVALGILFIDDDFVLAICSIVIAAIGVLLGCYYISRSFIVNNRPKITYFILPLIIWGVWVSIYLYEIHKDCFNRLDYDAGGAKTMAALYTAFLPILLFFVIFNHWQGTYKRIVTKYR